MVIKVIVLNVVMMLTGLGNPSIESKKNDSGSYEVVRNTTYKGQAFEAVYKVNYHNKIANTTRFFEVIKTTPQIKNYFLADFLLVEKIKNSSKVIFYPTGWVSIKFINVEELKQTCQQIVDGEIHSEVIE